MSLQSKPCWVCDIKHCRHIWDATDVTKPPQQCPKCRSKKWNVKGIIVQWEGEFSIQLKSKPN